MSARLVFLLALATACGSGGGDRDGGGTDAPDPDLPPAELPPPLEVGGYRLTITSDFSWAPGPRVTLEPDGSFIGHDYESLWDCTGAFSPSERAELTQALDAAWVLTRGDVAGAAPGSEPSSFDFTIEATTGPAAGMYNSFHYQRGSVGVPTLDRLVAVALVPVRAVQATGTCNLCAPEVAEWRTCHEEQPFGQSRVCADGVANDCTPEHAGDLVACRERAVVCDADYGWLPTETWELRSARAWRTTSDGAPRIDLEVSIWVDGITTYNEAMNNFQDHLRIEDPETGATLELLDPASSTIWSGIPFELPGLATLRMFSRTPAGPARTIPEIDVRLRPRPWDGLPYGAPLLVPIGTEAPPTF